MSWPTPGVSGFLAIAPLVTVKGHLTGVSIYISPISDVDTPFRVLLAICISLEKCLFEAFSLSRSRSALLLRFSSAGGRQLIRHVT